MPLLLLELNEINFDHVRSYVGLGKLPVLGRLIARHGLTETVSEQNYDELEPWIQWVTAHTGMTLAEHKVFRLGDIVKHDIPQIWEALEAQGLKVGAISPMNAKNRCRAPAFFVPDPWTPTRVSGSRTMKRLYRAVAQAVNDNAQSRVTASSAAGLLAGLAAYARPVNYGGYLALFGAAARRRPWAKALILDQLLADIFIRQVRRGRPDFASLFLNAGAHIQHHYMFNSEVYDGPHANPGWYVDADRDPVLEAYALYDRIVGQVERAFPDARLMLATGLHQDPHREVTFYWRLKDHEAFLERAGVPFRSVEARMSRDFLVSCADAEEARRAEQRLAAIKAADGRPLFEVDNRGDDLFVMLIWPDDIKEDFEYHIGNEPIGGLRDEVAFVAIKNGSHNGIGYMLDTGARTAPAAAEPMALSDMPRRIAEALGVRWEEAAA
ncbi:MAG: hypothetical protein QOD42_3693 [Sphingomonadales bacterium]|jgi:hypothetical protein|nr:hypothetical protein [Sphingomonadales bacterium]